MPSVPSSSVPIGTTAGHGVGSAACVASWSSVRVQVQWFGTEALELTYKDPSGRVANQILEGAPGRLAKLGDGRFFIERARRYASDRIAVNSIAPAMTETPLFGVLSQEVLDRAIAQMPHGRAMQPSEIAAWVGFLISQAGDICSGNVIILNQGRDVR